MSDTITAGELRRVALSSIIVRDGFNPRTAFDEAQIARLADTVRASGVLQALLVQPASDPDGGYELVDGERRYRAAGLAGLTEVPVLICPRDDETGGLISALTANFHRQAHTPVEEARAFARLLAAGLTRKGVCERLRVSRELVRDRLEILELPDHLHPALDDGTIPLGAIRTLAALAKIHPDLPACALRRVSTVPADSWRRRVSWADVVADPIGAVSCQYGDEHPDLPAGIYEAHAEYPLTAFQLSERAEKDLAALARLNPAYADRDQVVVCFDRDSVEHATKLGSAHASEHRHSALIVGEDVAAQLVADQLKARLRDERARVRHARELAATTGGNPPAAGAIGAAVEPESEEQAKARRAGERAAEQQHRATAVAYNTSLGVAVLKAFAKTKLDARVIQVLTAVDFKDDLDALAHRGARYCLPGWTREEQTKTGKPKTIYLERHEAAARAHEFLAGATSPEEIAGRCLAIVVLAVLADETCLAQSNRSMVSLHDYQPSPHHPAGGQERGLPWRRDVVALVGELALERLAEHLTHRDQPTHDEATAPEPETPSAPTDGASGVEKTVQALAVQAGAAPADGAGEQSAA